VLGRKTDLIIVGGRKFYPNDIEHAASAIDGVKEGRVVAFGLPNEERGTEEVVVLVESVHHEDRARVQAIKKEIKGRVLREVDCTVDHTRVLAPRSLIKTSSGKIARAENRRWFAGHIAARSEA
jgi:fatty-acyl-CoA synthase